MRALILVTSIAITLACAGGDLDGAPDPVDELGFDFDFSEWRHDDGDVYRFRPGGRVERQAGSGAFAFGTEGSWTRAGRDVHIVWRAGEDEDDVRVVDACSALWMQSFGEETAIRTFPAGCVAR